jgi:hypothetical protein
LQIEWILKNKKMDKFDLKKYLTEGKLSEGYKIGDEVILRGAETVTDTLKVTDMRKMFGTNLMAYTVEFPDGSVAEYDETQLSLKPKGYGFPEIDMDKVFMKGKVSDEEAMDGIMHDAPDRYNESLKEGVWEVGSKQGIEEFIKKVNDLKDIYYNTVGSDDVFNGLDQAIKGAEELSSIAKDNPAEKAYRDSKSGKSIKEQYSTHGGYVELMDLDDHLDSIHYEFERWREGPSTEITDIEPAKEDVISYVVDYLRNTL